MPSDGQDYPNDADRLRRGAAQRFKEAELPLAKLWTYYYGIGGDLDEMSLDAYLHEALDIPAVQVTLVATAMAEMTEGDLL
ncbi:hypothetical protein [Pseudarthrobacter sp. NamB4]|uniref:hypothetical protein n=1 Tax=Pseudarthrobacter sp. NamB4 TaxID=2576837 RepID=UPI0010FE82A7|nr:hypothetical protein [Pseudarthrobacter sp. NamB4]TLM71303.1 hypothetical protein FDW81_16155 [Pseudarthrobacter sp. NamB4]